MSIPIIATLALLAGLAYWNDWLNGLYYISDDRLFSIQVLLNRMLLDVQFLMSNSDAAKSLQQKRVCAALHRYSDGSGCYGCVAYSGGISFLSKILCKGYCYWRRKRLMFQVNNFLRGVFDMTKQYRFAHTDSVYTHQPDDPRAVVLQTDGLQPDERGIYDVTERLPGAFGQC